MIALTDLGRQRYRDHLTATTDRPALQLQFEGDGWFVIGVPRAGDMVRLRRSMAARGVELNGVSWQPGRRRRA